MAETKVASKQQSTIVIIALIVIALLAIYFMYRATSQSPQASNDSSGALDLDSSLTNRGINVLVKSAVGGVGTTAFLDIYEDLDNSCQIVSGAPATLDETATDGTATLTLASNRAYIIKATNKNAAGEGTAAVAVGSVSSNSCAEEVRTANSEPIVIEMK